MENNAKTNLYKSLAAAQAEFHPAIKDADNPFFKSKYADLSAVWEACKEAIAKNNLFVSQQPGWCNEANCWVIRTKIYNDAGEFIEGVSPIITAKQNDPQSFGAAMTYTRRYGLAATLGIVVDDDDAEGAMNRNPKPAARTNPAPTTQTVQHGQEAPVQVDTSTGEVIKYASAKQKEEIMRLLNNPCIERGEKTKMLLNINKISEEKAAQVIVKLKTVIEEREEQSATA